MNAKFIMNDRGFFLIEVNGKRSNPVSYSGIATLEVDGKIYAGVSACYAGAIPHETVFEIKKLPDVKNLEENFEFPVPKLKD